jgi:hypothetical protein
MAQQISVGREGLQVHGKPFYLLSGCIHYFRYPPAEWRDILLKARAAGLNTVDSVIPWNLHEPEEGRFVFEGEADLAAWLDLCTELGLYAIVRPGPYICAEWENGGLPAWLTARADALRVDDPAYLAATLRWFERLFPLLVPRQASRGGPIILCQIENEHWASGRYGNDLHQTTLAHMAEELGMDVPQYTCMGGMRGYVEFRNGWNNIAEKLVQTRAAWPDNPMIVSELWSGWFDSWGASRHSHKSAASLERVLQQLTAVGCSGFSHWMFAGGTNFGFWGGRTVGGDAIHMTTSYDYDALVGEYGELREKYYVARPHHLLLGTLGAELSRVLADARPGGPTVIGQAAVPGRSAGGGGAFRSVRASPAAPERWRDFTAVFLDNAATDGLAVQVFHQQPAARLSVDVEPLAIKPLFARLPLGQGGLFLDYHSSRLLGFWQQEMRDVLVFHGAPGEVGLCQLRYEHEPPLLLRYWIGARPTLRRERLGQREVLVVLLTTARAQRWWPLADGRFLCGPDLVVEDQDALRVAWGALEPYEVDITGVLRVFSLPMQSEEMQVAPPLAGRAPLASALTWERQAVAEREGSQGWQAIPQPLAFEALGNYLGYGWYRAELELAEDIHTTLLAPQLRDRARVLLDGADLGWLGVHPWGSRYELELDLGRGGHELRLCVDNLGRFNYGSNTGEQKGLFDTLYLGGRQHNIAGGWVALWQEAVFAGEALALARPEAVRPDGEDVDLGNFAFSGPSVWLLRAFEARAGYRYMLRLTGDRNPGALFVNGVAVARFSRHRSGGLIEAQLDEVVRPGWNVIALNIQGYAGFPWTALLLEWQASEALEARWSFRAGLTPGAAAAGVGLCFWRARFDYDATTQGAGPFALELHGLSKGQLWINGRNLGRYWQSVGPQERTKLPASWLQPRNELLVFDEEGADPHELRIVR